MAEFDYCSGGHPGFGYKEHENYRCTRCGRILDMEPCECGAPGHEELAWSFCPNRYMLTRGEL